MEQRVMARGTVYRPVVSGYELAPVWGQAAGNAEALWQQDNVLAQYTGLGAVEDTGWRPARTEARVSYGWRRWGGLLTPYGELGLSGSGSRQSRLGLQFGHAGAVWPLNWVRSMNLELVLEQQQQPAAPAEHSLNFKGSLRYQGNRVNG